MADIAHDKTSEGQLPKLRMECGNSSPVGFLPLVKELNRGSVHLVENGVRILQWTR